MALYTYQTKPPLTVPGCTVWMDMADTNTISDSGGSVTEVVNKARRDNNLIQPTGAQRPTTGVATYNGHNVVSYTSGTSEHLYFEQPLLAASAPITVFLVAQSHSSTGSEQYFCARVGGASGAFRFVKQANDYTNGYIFDNTGTLGAGGFISGGNVNANIWFSSWEDGSYMYQAFNGNTPSESARVVNAYDNSNTSAFPIGGALGGAAIDGWVGEFIKFDRVITETERVYITRYLANKWGISI